MPKAPAKKTKPKTAPKGAKPKAKKKAKKAAPGPAPERGFMWKILKQKQAEKNGPKPEPNSFGEDRFKNYSREPSFTKFAGPRRRAG